MVSMTTNLFKNFLMLTNKLNFLSIIKKFLVHEYQFAKFQTSCNKLQLIVIWHVWCNNDVSVFWQQILNIITVIYSFVLVVLFKLFEKVGYCFSSIWKLEKRMLMYSDSCVKSSVKTDLNMM